MIDPIDKNNDLVYLVDLIQKLSSNLHKWSALHLLIQAAIIVAVATFMGWGLKGDAYLRTGIISGFCVFAIIISILVLHNLIRSRRHLKHYIRMAARIEQDNPRLFKKEGHESTHNLITTFIVAHLAIILAWVVFLIVLIK